MQALAEQIARGDIPLQRIEASLQRIKTAKQRWLAPCPVRSDAALNELIGSPAHQRIAAALRDAASELASAGR
jgi:hypothetical protein